MDNGPMNSGFIGVPYSRSFPRMHPRTGRALRRRLGRRFVFLYGLYDLSGSCRYVGQTTNPYSRLMTHRTQGLMLEHGPMLMKVLRFAVPIEAPRIEKQIVFAYRKSGQCDLNKQDKFVVKNRAAAKPVLWVQKAHWFESASDAAEYFNCSRQTIINWIRGEHTPDAITLKLHG